MDTTPHNTPDFLELLLGGRFSVTVQWLPFGWTTTVGSITSLSGPIRCFHYVLSLTDLVLGPPPRILSLKTFRGISPTSNQPTSSTPLSRTCRQRQTEPPQTDGDTLRGDPGTFLVKLRNKKPNKQIFTPIFIMDENPIDIPNLLN